MPDLKSLIANLPSPLELFHAAKAWIVANGMWWGGSALGHFVVLSALLVVLGKVTAPRLEGEAPAFESRVDTEIPPPELDHFDVGETPIEATELTTETLSLVDAPAIEASSEIGDASDSIGGGAAGPATGGIGGLDGFAVQGLGPGPLVRGTGLAPPAAVAAPAAAEKAKASARAATKTPAGP